MDAADALADLTEISSQIEAAVLVDADGAVAASTFAAGDGRTRRLADGALRLLAEAGEPAPERLEAATAAGSVFAVRAGDRTIAAVTGPDPVSGLVLHDLRRCLESVDA